MASGFHGDVGEARDRGENIRSMARKMAALRC